MAEVASSHAAASVTWLYRQPHWPIPRRVLGIPIRSMFFNRCISAALPPYYDAGRAGRVGGMLAQPLQRMLWWAFEGVIKVSVTPGDRETEGGDEGGRERVGREGASFGKGPKP